MAKNKHLLSIFIKAYRKIPKVEKKTILKQLNIDNNAKQMIIMPTNNLFAKASNCELL